MPGRERRGAQTTRGEVLSAEDTKRVKRFHAAHFTRKAAIAALGVGEQTFDAAITGGRMLRQTREHILAKLAEAGL